MPVRVEAYLYSYTLVGQAKNPHLGFRLESGPRGRRKFEAFMSGGMVLVHKSSAVLNIVLRQIIHRAAVLLGAASLLWGSAQGAEVPQVAPHPVRDFNTYQPAALATRIDAFVCAKPSRRR